MTTRPNDHPTTWQERNLLLLAAAFVLVGDVLLGLARPALERPALLAILASWLLCFTTAHLAFTYILPYRDPLLLPAAGLLMGWGLLLIARLAPGFLSRQIIWMVIGTATLILVGLLSRPQGRVPGLSWLRRFKYTWLLGGLALLAATLVFGANPSGQGPRLWLRLGPLYFQPSEPLKLLMTVYLAAYLAEKRALLYPETWPVGSLSQPPPWRRTARPPASPVLPYLVPLLAMWGLAMVLLAWQQDLGAALLFFFTFLVMLYLAGGRGGDILLGLTLFVIGAAIAYRLSGRVALRVDIWLDPWSEAGGRAYQIVQSLLAFAAGGLLGQGLGLGYPTPYIPAIHTDFPFAAIGEEFGLLGVLAAVALYALLTLRGYRMALRARTGFQQLLAAGLATMLGLQAWTIMAGTLKLIPLTGVTLPFVSYGGSSLLSSFLTLGLLLAISHENGLAVEAPERKPISANQRLRPLARPSAIRRVGGLMLVGFLLVGASGGYWSLWRGPSLQAREDNPRRLIAEQRIQRGRILDRQGVVLAETVGPPEAHQRRYPYPVAAPVVGYYSLRHGVGGIEATFDEVLRGTREEVDWEGWLERLMHRVPVGRDVRLTLDVSLQQVADNALGKQVGAVVLIDITNGDLLVMVSHPTFDPNQLDETWEALSQDPMAPLLNRVTQGLYQPGGVLESLLLAEGIAARLADPDALLENATQAVRLDDLVLTCQPPGGIPTVAPLAQAYEANCPAPFLALGEQMGVQRVATAFVRWGLNQPPPLEVPTEAGRFDPTRLKSPEGLARAVLGQGDLTVTPLQMVLVAATIARDGERPAPRLVLEVEDLTGQMQPWEGARGKPVRVLRPAPVSRLRSVMPRWGEGKVVGHGSIAVAGANRPPHAWFIGYAPAGAPRYAIAVLLEHGGEEGPRQAVQVGIAVLQAALR